MTTKISNLRTQLEALNTEKKALVTGIKFTDRDREAYTKISHEIEKIEKEIKAEELKEEIKSANNFNARVWEAWQEVKNYQGEIFKADGSHTKKFNDFLRPIKTKTELYISAKYRSEGTEFKFSENLIHSHHKETIYSNNPPTEKKKEIKFSEVLKARKEHNKLIAQLEAIQNKLNSNFLIACASYDLIADDRKYKFSHI